MPFVVVQTFPNEIAAEVARAALAANGIDAIVRRNDAAGLLQFVHGVQLVTRAEDAALARRLLTTPPDVSPETDAAGAEADGRDEAGGQAPWGEAAEWDAPDAWGDGDERDESDRGGDGGAHR